MHKLELPEPGEIEKQNSARLRAVIEQAIETAGGWIDFAEFMQLALYAPGLGYYSAGLQKFGEQGDFVTAPEISPLFGAALAQPVAEGLQAMGGGDIMEFGAGSGRLAVDLLLQLEKLQRLPEQYCIVELSAELRQRQQQTLKESCGDLVDRVCWLDGLPDEPVDAVVVANEVLDAMPVRRFRIGEEGIEALGVIVGDSGLLLQTRPADVELRLAVEHLQQDMGRELPLHYESEINLHIEPWMQSLSASLCRGAVYIVDYGYPRAEYYMPERHTGTFMGYYRHRAFDEPLWYPGLQDLTAFVDFTAVAEAGVASGFEVEGFTSQGNFLMDCGVMQLLEDDDSVTEHQRLQTMQQVKTLTMNSEMGERFKVLGLSKNLQLPPRGFGLRDFIYRL